jgi:hypothetical protein
MDKQQILAAALVAVLVVGVSVYRLLWAGSSSAAAVGLRRFPKTPGKMLKWIFGGRDDGNSGQTKPEDRASRS